MRVIAGKLRKNRKHKSFNYSSENPYLLFELAGDEVDRYRELLLLVERLAEELGHQPHNPLIHQNFIEPASTVHTITSEQSCGSWRIRMFLGLLDLDPDLLVRGMDPNLAPAPDPSHQPKIVRIPTIW